MAWKIHNELQKHVNEHNKLAKKKAEEEFYRTPLGKAIKKVEDLSKPFKAHYMPINSNFLNQVMKTDLKSTPYIDTLENEIILAQIDSNSTDEVIERITEKYKNR